MSFNVLRCQGNIVGRDNNVNVQELRVHRGKLTLEHGDCFNTELLANFVRDRIARSAYMLLLI